ncbi:MAG TPA: T9SS type A sorting domain-containing protein [Bacteroidales bacterium]|nr:T9SS type A sorting domain-containing protein [Bacteroidales bacterium]HSA42689.1 T9SS type A sorting domain-containing protein [Bacteroidales bacterium]
MTRITAILIITLLPFISRAQWQSQWTAFQQERWVEHISMADNNTVWITGRTSGSTSSLSRDFSRTTNGGSTWQAGTIDLLEGFGLGMIHAYDGTTAWACLQSIADTGGFIIQTTDGGQNWNIQPTAVFSVNPEIIHFFDADSGLAIGQPHDGNFEIWVTTDGGNNWDSIPASDMPLAYDEERTSHRVYWVKGDSLWFGGSTNGRIFYSYDRSYHWSFLPFPEPQVHVVVFRDTVGLAGRLDPLLDEYSLYQTQDQGQTWIKTGAAGLTGISCMTFVPGTVSTILACGDNLMISNDWGASFLPMEAPQGNQTCSLIAFRDISTGWLGSVNNTASSQGGIFKYNGPPLQIKNIAPETRTVIYPNPSPGNATLEITAGKQESISLQISDLSGKLLSMNQFDLNPGVNLLPVTAANLPPGVYIVHWNSNDTIHHNLLVRN